MKTFQEWLLAENKFSNDHELNSKIVWDDQHQAWYDEHWPFDDDEIHQFLTHAAAGHNVKEFEVHANLNTSGYSYAPTGVTGPVDQSDPGDYDSHTTMQDFTLYADGTPVTMPPNVRRHFIDFYSSRLKH